MVPVQHMFHQERKSPVHIFYTSDTMVQYFHT